MCLVPNVDGVSRVSVVDCLFCFLSVLFSNIFWVWNLNEEYHMWLVEWDYRFTTLQVTTLIYLSFAGPWIYFRFLVGSVLLILLVFCVVLWFFLGFFVFVLCLVCPVLLVSLHRPLLIAPSVFSGVYLSLYYIMHLLHAGEGNMKIYSPKSIIFPEDQGNMILVGEYIFISPEPACYKCFIISNETKKTHTCKILLASIF